MSPGFFFRLTHRTLILSALVVLLSACAGTKKHDEKREAEIIFRFACEHPRGYPTTDAAYSMAETVERESRGRIRVKIYEAGRLGDERSVVEQVRFGGIDLAAVSLGSLADYSKEAFLLDRRESASAVDAPSLGSSELTEELNREKILLLGRYLGGRDYVMTAGRPASSYADLRNVKIGLRATQGRMAFFHGVGAIPGPLKGGALYEALKKGYIDGGHENLLSFHDGKHYESARYVAALPGISSPDLVIGSRVVLMQLPRADREMIENAALLSSALQLRLWREREAEVRDRLKKAGILFGAGEETK